MSAAPASARRVGTAPGRSARPRAFAAATIAVIAAVAVCVPTTPVGAAGDGGASSRVTTEGDILTSIVGSSRSSGSRRRSGPPPDCWWQTLPGGTLELVASLTAEFARLGLPTPDVDPIRPLLGPDAPDAEVQQRTCRGAAGGELRLVPRNTPRPTTEVLLRRMITRLPDPRPLISPPEAAAVPLGHPVFVSVPPEDWQEVSGTIEVDGTAAEVRATPISLRVISGDPRGGFTTCDGPGHPFDPTAGDGPRRQSRRPGACTVSYSSANTPMRPLDAIAAARPPRWIGAVTVVWDAEWRVGGGPWRSLGLVPRTRLTDRVAREVTTAIESPRR